MNVIDDTLGSVYSFRMGTALVNAALLHLSNLLPNNLVVVTIAAMVPVMGMYLLLEKQFSKSGMLGPIQQHSALGRLMQAE
jgi:hypothetical protein